MEQPHPRDERQWQAEWAATLYSGLLRYQVRVGAYIMLRPVPYPPFSLK
jgi:hypothetical protein